MKYNYDIKWIEIIDSTNTELHRKMDSLDNLSVLAAGYQTAGRGQRGNRWLSRSWENLTFSILVKWEENQVRSANQFIISKIATLSIYDYLTGYNIPCTIKWPNDIYVRDKKICGMLIENSLAGSSVTSSIIGIGLNVNQTEFDPQLLNPTSMTKLTGKNWNVKEELPHLMDLFVHRLSSYLDQNDSQGIDQEYESHLYRKCEMHSYRDLLKDEIFNGKILGVAEDGRLEVAISGKITKLFSFKEIGYIL